MILYFLDGNKYYTGISQEVPDTDPIPGNCVVDVHLPTLNSGEHACWDGHNWFVTTTTPDQYQTAKKEEHDNQQAELQRQQQRNSIYYKAPDEHINWNDVRNTRDGLLSSSDWTQMPDYNGTKKTEWATYRQALRDLPETYKTAIMMSEITWPTPPQ